VQKGEIIVSELKKLEEQLNSFDGTLRRHVLEELSEQYRHILLQEGTNINMHFHSFFSYNSEWYSPSRIAWESAKKGLYAAGLCDFDVLEGLEEFLHAGAVLRLRTTVNIETRAFMAEYADVDVNSPGEQGVVYIMGAGFFETPGENSTQRNVLLDYGRRAQVRNIGLVERINKKIPDIEIDYAKDVLPLTPAGGATERHVVRAYVHKAKAVFVSEQKIAEFWSDILGVRIEDTLALLSDTPALEDAVRARLVKRGGIGYRKPDRTTFPPVETFISWVSSCGAIPMITWLDGTSEGEKNGRDMLECMKAKGAAALNIIPERNWNISDAAERELKISKLDEIVSHAEEMGLPLNIGTEMNKAGLPFVDDLDAAPLRKHKEVFLRGAQIMVGHTLCAKYADYPYTGIQAEADYPRIADKNRFFAAVGRIPAIDTGRARELERMGKKAAFEWLHSQSSE
jgi:hypothetical protein